MHKPSDPRNSVVAEAHIYGKNTCSTVSCFNSPWAFANAAGVEAWTWTTWGNCEALIANYNGTAYSAFGTWVRNYFLTH